MSNVGAGRFTRYGTPGMDLDACEVTTSNGARFVLAPDLNGGLRVLLRWRGDASDADLIRAARKHAGTIAPVTVDIDDTPIAYPKQVEPFRGVHGIHPGSRIVVAPDVDRVWTVTAVTVATADERGVWASHGQDRFRYEQSGGKLSTLHLMSDAGESTVTVANRYDRPIAAWVLPGHDHWPRCNDCREPWPCRAHSRNVDEARRANWDYKRCHRCGKHDGALFVFPRSAGFPSRTAWHARTGACLNAAKRHAAAHGWVLHDGKAVHDRWFYRASDSSNGTGTDVALADRISPR